MNTETAALREIGELIRTQDNRGTADPLFLVQEKERIYRVSEEDATGYVLLDEDWNEIQNVKMEDAPDDLETESVDDPGLEKVYYRNIWKFVTACFTEQGCKDYIRANGHNLNEPRIYAATLYRNYEMIGVRNALKSQEKSSDGKRRWYS